MKFPSWIRSRRSDITCDHSLSELDKIELLRDALTKAEERVEKLEKQMAKLLGWAATMDTCADWMQGMAPKPEFFFGETENEEGP